MYILINRYNVLYYINVRIGLNNINYKKLTGGAV